MLEGWQDYLDRNWLNDNGEDLFSPELRVKRFLDSVGYYLLYGRTDGIVTAYKEAANRAREIPVSSCPGEVSNIMYAGNGNVDDEDEKQSFRTMTEILDERAPKRKPPQKKKTVSLRQKMQNIRDENNGAEVLRFKIDTNGHFSYGGCQMMVWHYDKYNAKVVRKRNGETDILFDMDTIMRCGNRWYDQNGDEIPDGCVSEI